MKEHYQVAICQGEWDWQMSIDFNFQTLEETVNFVKLCLEQNLIVQMRKVEE